MRLSLARFSCRWSSIVLVVGSWYLVGFLLAGNPGMHRSDSYSTTEELGFKNAINDTFGVITLKGLKVSLLASLVQESDFGIHSKDIFEHVLSSLESANIPLQEFSRNSLSPVLYVRILSTPVQNSNIVVFYVETELYQPALTLLSEVPTVTKTWGSHSHFGYVRYDKENDAGAVYVLEAIQASVQEFIDDYRITNP